MAKIHISNLRCQSSLVCPTWVYEDYREGRSLSGKFSGFFKRLLEDDISYFIEIGVEELFPGLEEEEFR